MKYWNALSCFFVIGLMLMLKFGTAYAVLPDEVLSDPALEARARTLSKDIRCMVCQNQSIDDSDADLARDLRIVLRKRLLAGDDDKAIKQYLVDRYGNFVLLNPPLMPSTIILWVAPFGFLISGFGIYWLWRRKENNRLLFTSETQDLDLQDALNDKNFVSDKEVDQYLNKLDEKQ